MSIYSFTPYMWIITTFVPIYTYIWSHIPISYRPHGSVDVPYSPMGIYDHLPTGGRGSHILTYPHSYIPTRTHPPTGGDGDHHYPTCRPIPFGGVGWWGKGIAASYIYIFIYTYWYCNNKWSDRLCIYTYIYTHTYTHNTMVRWWQIHVLLQIFLEISPAILGAAEDPMVGFIFFLWWLVVLGGSVHWLFCI